MQSIGDRGAVRAGDATHEFYGSSLRDENNAPNGFDARSGKSALYTRYTYNCARGSFAVTLRGSIAGKWPEAKSDDVVSSFAVVTALYKGANPFRRVSHFCISNPRRTRFSVPLSRLLLNRTVRILAVVQTSGLALQGALVAAEEILLSTQNRLVFANLN